jgi:hypothetical protein
MSDEKDDGAGLIHQAIPDMEGTLPRPNRRLFGDPAKSGGDWIRMGCQNATFVTPACRVGDPDCLTCEVAAEYDRMEAANAK